ncbi:MAG: cohesin domain-containing protein [Acutalibacteraceae bacterium]
MRRLGSALLMAFIIIGSFTMISMASNTPVITADNVEAMPGETVDMKIRIENNPGIVSANLKISFDSDLTLVNAVNGNVFPSSINFIKPKKLLNVEEITGECRLMWQGFDIAKSDIKDGIMVVLSFRLSEKAQKGKVHTVTVSTEYGDVVDKDLNCIVLNTAGKISAGHTLKKVQAKQPTCTETGNIEYYVCTVCKKKFADGNGKKEITAKSTIISPKGHSYKTTITKATTAKDGKKVSVCSVCRSIGKTVVIPKVSTIALSAAKYTYDGTVKTPSIIVKDRNGSVLVKNRDYVLSFSPGRKNTGKYSVTVQLTGNYSGSKTVEFYIVPGKTSKISVSLTTSSIKASWKSVTGASGYKVYLFKGNKCMQHGYTADTTFTFSKLHSGTDYRIAVKAYKAIDGAKCYSDSYTALNTTTRPDTPTLKVVPGTKKAMLSWTKQTGADGYVVYMATSKNGKYTKIATQNGNDKISYTKTGLTRGSCYYFKVAAYSTAESGRVYSSFSCVKYAKIK